jgi:peptide/nickel transport system permease protein
VRALFSYLRRRPGLGIGGSIIALLLLASFFAPLPHDPIVAVPSRALEAPSSEYIFGTDRTGFDVFSRTIRAARLDLALAVAGTLISMVLGVPLGLLASTKNKWSERLMRGLDTFQAFPLLVLAIAVVSLTGNNLKNVVVAIGLINTPRFMRLVRADALAVRESRYVEAAISVGASPVRILRKHVLPNVSGIILVQATLAAANAIVVISALSFVGIGVTPPTPSWGAMIRSGSQNIASGSWWMSVFPGVAVVIAVWALNKIADGVQAGIGRSR